MLDSGKIPSLAVAAAGALLIVLATNAAAPNAGVQACAPAEGEGFQAATPEPMDAAQQVLVAHVSQRFHVAPSETALVVATAYRAAREVGLDPLLVLAVISIESSFNPVAVSSMGAKGLMQIIPRYHLGKLREAGGEHAVFDLESNIHVGARILQEYVHRKGTLEAGLQLYNGAWRDNSAQYAAKVLAERGRLERVLRQRTRMTAAAFDRQT